MPKLNRQNGFTLIELMIAMAISGIVLAGIYGLYQDQLRTKISQQRVVDMNQNLRTAVLIIEKDLRMGGANPTGDAPAGITTATANTLVLAMDDGGTDNIAGNASNALDDGIDNDGSGTADEGSNGADDDGDGLIDEEDEAEWYDGDTTDAGEVVMYDLNNGNLRRWTNTAGSANPTNALWIASNIDALNFVYLDGSDPPNVIPSPVTGTDRENIRNVQVTIVARDGATEPVLAPPHVDNMIYRNPRGNDPLGDVLLDLSASPDSFRRRIVTTTIKCRNMGL